MSRNTLEIKAPPREVLAVLLDADAYADWVVGSKELRHVEPDWPSPGSRFHHTQGAGPLTLEDDTEVLALSERRLVLDVHYRPLGTARVTLSLGERQGGAATLVTMDEVPTSGFTARLPRFLTDPAFHGRNQLSLRRLARLVERRHGGAPAV
jgi:hypothetical protein